MVKAAEKKRSPLIIQMFPWAVTFSSGLLVYAAAQAAKSASVPVAIHLDHAQDEALIKQAAELPFDSIMVDMSHYEMDENLRKTAGLVKYCNDRKITTEAEPGRIEGGEDGVADTFDLTSSLTTEKQVEDFIDTGVDFLAPAFGNVHGEYGTRGPVLEFDRYVFNSGWREACSPDNRLEMIRQKVRNRVRIVLHGTNDFTESIMKKCITGGISKVNVNKLVLEDYLQHLKANASMLPLTTLMEQGVDKVQKLMEWQMDVCGSTGKA